MRSLQDEGGGRGHENREAREDGPTVQSGGMRGMRGIELAGYGVSCDIQPRRRLYTCGVAAAPLLPVNKRARNAGNVGVPIVGHLGSSVQGQHRKGSIACSLYSLTIGSCRDEEGNVTGTLHRSRRPDHQ